MVNCAFSGLECRKSGLFLIWHASCEVFGIRGNPATSDQTQRTTMKIINSTRGRLAAAFTAFSLSLVLFTGTVSTPVQAHTAHGTYVGVVA
jgi:hypothetical protein